MAIANLLDALINLLLLAILARAVWSWVNPRSRHPVHVVLVRVTEPLLQPIRSMLPSSGAFDFSPVVAMILLSLIRRLIV